MEYIPQSRARQNAYEELEAARIKSEQTSIIQDINRGIHAAVLCDAITHLTRRIDAFTARRTEKARRDAEEREAAEQQLIEDTLSALPDPENPHAWETAGELTPVQASEPAHEEQLAASDQGDVPAEISKDPPDTDPDLTKSRAPEAKNPVGISW
jgi:hypothetical protein